MSNPNIEVLNDVTKTLIDSQKGYEKVCEVADENHGLRNKFKTLAYERSELVTAFQARVRDLGGEPETEGGTAGTLHRGWAEFTSLFMSDEKAALEAVDDGEDYLGDRIDSKLEKTDLDPETVELLKRAKNSARQGENFADALT